MGISVKSGNSVNTQMKSRSISNLHEGKADHDHFKWWTQFISSLNLILWEKKLILTFQIVWEILTIKESCSLNGWEGKPNHNQYDTQFDPVLNLFQQGQNHNPSISSGATADKLSCNLIGLQNLGLKQCR